MYESVNVYTHIQRTYILRRWDSYKLTYVQKEVPNFIL